MNLNFHKDTTIFLPAKISQFFVIIFSHPFLYRIPAPEAGRIDLDGTENNCNFAIRKKPQ